MRFSVTPFEHPDHTALLERSQSLARLWEMGHVFMVVSLAIALVVPLGVLMVAMIDRDVTSERAWDVAESGAAAALVISALGFAARRYAREKGLRLPGR
jgi:hypothetical protein